MKIASHLYEEMRRDAAKETGGEGDANSAEMQSSDIDEEAFVAIIAPLSIDWETGEIVAYDAAKYEGQTNFDLNDPG